ncbi:Na+/H+ antiporter [Paenibacillus thalictri]|uniref:Na+/H+ antiporter n=1 Tax=Paenibacillus thalictri TaxID=2527873 RepID=A0A4Q9DP54_9BACL|nr:Na+/H+ antiporter [Paenibacillus thalictri]TBL77851.1 Na+/H+ antiporter [Paenibacillus thalictri]
METFLVILILLALLGVSNIINRVIPFVPVPLIQIALGVIVAQMPSGIHLPLEPELFFVLFIAPLLFNDGKRTPRDELWNLRAPILLLAVGLVFITVLVAGYAIHWLIPTIPLAAAFGLAAILSPTDAVAVGSLAGRINLPKRILHLLEGEALMNDASGLVAFKFAIAAALTGVFSLPQATVSFFIISIGGVVIGVVMSMMMIWLRMLLRRFGMEDVTVHMIIQIITPFLLYLVAEEFGMSGILAAVAGGIVHAVEQDNSQSTMIKLQMVSANTWSVILFVLNGLVFVILGLQIPAVSSVIFRDPHYSNYQSLGYIVIIYVLLIVLRFLWISLYTRFYQYKGGESPGIKSIVLTSLSGVRGAVTLAGAFSIPLFLEDGSPFPERNLIIFVAAGVILISLILASVLLPLLTKEKETMDEAEEEQLENNVQIQIMNAAIKAVKLEQNDDNEAAAHSVILEYKRWIQQLVATDRERSHFQSREKEAELRQIAFNKEREVARELIAGGELSPMAAVFFKKTLDQTELILANRFHVWRILFSVLLKRIKGALFGGKDNKMKKLTERDEEKLKKLKVKTSEAAIAELRQHMTKENEAAALNLIAYYSTIIERLCRMPAPNQTEDECYCEQKKELHTAAIQAERDAVQALFEKGEINRATANKLRQHISFREAAVFEEDEIG